MAFLGNIGSGGYEVYFNSEWRKVMRVVYASFVQPFSHTSQLRLLLEDFDVSRCKFLLSPLYRSVPLSFCYYLDSLLYWKVSCIVP
jgi:hypothetical protein